MVTQVKHCCFVTDLRKATIAIAIYYSLYSLMCTTAGLTLPEKVVFIHVEEYFLVAGGAITSVLELIVSLALLCGAMEEKPSFISPWLATNCVLFLGSIIFLILGTISMVIRSQSFLLMMAVLIPSTLILVLTFYFLIVVNSYYVQLCKKIKTESEQNYLTLVSHTHTNGGFINIHPDVLMARSIQEQIIDRKQGFTPITLDVRQYSECQG